MRQHKKKICTSDVEIPCYTKNCEKVEENGQALEGNSDVFKNVVLATFALEFGLALQRGIFNNFVVEVVGINPSELGFVQGVREIPGLLTAPLAMLSRFFSRKCLCWTMHNYSRLWFVITHAGRQPPMLLCHTCAFFRIPPFLSSAIINGSQVVSSY